MKTPILKVEDLNISYPNKKRPIVENGSFEVYSGEIVLILGENGTGKSSIFKSLVGDIEQDLISLFKNKIKKFLSNPFSKKDSKVEISKTMYLDGSLINNDNQDIFRKKIGYVRQHDDDDSFFQKRVWNYVLDYVSHSYYYSNYSDQDKFKKIESDAQELYDKLDCQTYADGNLKKLKLKHLSGGEKRMTTLLSALSRKHSRLFIMDEPVNNLDGYHARKLNNYLVDLKKEKNAPGILIITHCPMFTNVDRVYRLINGKLILDESEYKFQTCFGEVDSNGKYYIEEE